MGDLLGSPRVASLFLWYFSIVSGNSMFFLLIKIGRASCSERVYCSVCGNNTTRTTRAHREACGHGRGAVKTFLFSSIRWHTSDLIVWSLDVCSSDVLRS